jgi:Fe-S-cluster formation regulator IscX/YfhJ
MTSRVTEILYHYFGPDFLRFTDLWKPYCQVRVSHDSSDRRGEVHAFTPSNGSICFLELYPSTVRFYKLKDLVETADYVRYIIEEEARIFFGKDGL